MTVTPDMVSPDAVKTKALVDDGSAAKSTKLTVDDASIAKAKAKLSIGLGEDQLGQDTNGDKMYKGKSLELGKGGRSLLLQDRIAMELVNKGYSLEQAQAIAKKQAFAHGTKAYGKEQMAKWAQSQGK